MGTVQKLAVVVLITLVFEGLLFGGDLVSQSYPSLRTVDFGSCVDADSGFGLGTIPCILGNVFLIVGNAFVFIFGTVVLAYNLMTFNIPGAPGYVRGIVSAVFGLPILLWIVTALIARSGSNS